MGGALRIHPVLILLSVIGGVLAVPAPVAGRVLFDFAHPRLRVRPRVLTENDPSPDG